MTGMHVGEAAPFKSKPFSVLLVTLHIFIIIASLVLKKHGKRPLFVDKIRHFWCRRMRVVLGITLLRSIEGVPLLQDDLKVIVFSHTKSLNLIQMKLLGSIW